MQQEKFSGLASFIVGDPAGVAKGQIVREIDALGGDVIHDPDNTEVGTFEVELTDAGRQDPLFGDLPAVNRGSPGTHHCQGPIVLGQQTPDLSSAAERTQGKNPSYRRGFLHDCKRFKPDQLAGC